MAKIRLDTNTVNVSAESLNLWFMKFIQEVCKENGQRYLGRTLYSMVCGIQRHLNMENGSLAFLLLVKNKLRYAFCLNWFPLYLFVKNPHFVIQTNIYILFLLCFSESITSRQF